MEGRPENVALRRIDQPGSQMCLADLFRQRPCCDDEQLLGHPFRLGRVYRHAHGWEDVDVVALSRHQAPPGEFDGRKRAAACKNCPSVRPTIDLFRRGLGSGGGIRIRKDDRTFVERGHRLDHFAGKELGYPADPDDAGRLESLDGLDECPDRRPLLHKGPLKLRKVSAPGYQKAIQVEQGIATPGGSNVQSLLRHRKTDQLGDAGGGGPSSEKEKTLIHQLLPGEAQRAKDAGQRDPGSALYVIVECADHILVFRQYRDGVEIGEVLPLDATLGIELLDGLDELADEVEVLAAAYARLTKTEIERIVDQLMIVGADVEHYRQAVLRRNTGAGRVESEFPERDAHAAGAEIPKAQDALPVRHDNETYVLLRPVFQQLLDASSRTDGDIQAPWLTE